MRNVWLLLLALASLPLCAAPPTNRSDLAIGLGLGSGLSGISIEHDVNSQNFLQGLVALGYNNAFGITADYGTIIPSILKESRHVKAYYGFGALIVREPYVWVDRYDRDLFENRTFAGVRLPLGMRGTIPETPLQLGGEIVPGMLLVPGTYVFFDLLLYIRYGF